MPMSNTPSVVSIRIRYWRAAYYLLLVAWVGCAVLVMKKIRAGVITNYGADLTQPAWLYVAFRDLHGSGRLRLLNRFVGSTPERAALSIFFVGVATEVSQRYWPSGFFAGRFDPFDIVAYALGIGTLSIRQTLPYLRKR